MLYTAGIFTIFYPLTLISYPHNFDVKRHTTKLSTQCIRASGVKLWNSLPREIKQAANLRVVKNLTKDYLIDNH